MREVFNMEVLLDKIKNRVYHMAGKQFDISSITSLRNTFITQSFVNKKDEKEQYKLFFRGDYELNYQEFPVLENYAKLYTEENFNKNHSVFIKHINGFIVFNVNDISKGNPTIIVYSDKNDLGHLIGKSGSAIKELEKTISMELSFPVRIIVKEINYIDLELK